MVLTVLDIVAKASVMLALAAAAAAALRRSSASARHLVWSLGLAGALAIPVLSFALPRWELPLITVSAPDASLARGADAMPASVRAADSSPSVPDASTATAPAIRHTPQRSAPAAEHVAWPTLPGIPMILLALWSLGAAIIVARAVLGVVAVQWMSRRTAIVTDAPWLPLAHELAADLGLRDVRFLRTSTASMPMAWGILRPAVLMPADADGWPAERLRIVLLHELAHVKRRDCLTHLFAQIACAAHWFNPLAWVAAKQLRTERERACDDLVLASGTRGSDYADQLLDIARAMRAGRFPAVLAGATLAMAHRSQLEGRLMAILDPTVPRRSPGRTMAVLAMTTFAMVALPMASVQPWAKETRPQSAQTSAQADPARTGTASSAPAATSERAVGREHATVRESAQATPVKPGRGIDGGIAGGVAGGVVGGVVDGVAGGIAEGVAGGVAEGVAEGVVGGIAGGVANAIEYAQDAKERIQKEKANEDAGKEKGREADPRAVAALIEALKDSDKGVRETAMSALAGIRDPRVFDPLVAALSDPSADIREQAAVGLGQLRDRRAVAPLAGVLAKDASASVREQAAFALGQIRSPEAVDALTGAIHDSSASVREQVVFALGQIRDQRAVDPLIAMLKDENADVREQAAFALGQIRSRSAVEALVVALKDSSAGVREQVAFALGQLRDPRAIDGLTLALKDASASVRQQAAFALGQIR